jgi:hypothetical protein
LVFGVYGFYQFEHQLAGLLHFPFEVRVRASHVLVIRHLDELVDIRAYLVDLVTEVGDTIGNLFFLCSFPVQNKLSQERADGSPFPEIKIVGLQDYLYFFQFRTVETERYGVHPFLVPQSFSAAFVTSHF